MRRLAPLIAVLATLAVAGCGAESSGGSFEGEEQQVAQVFEDLADAGQKGDERRVCRQLLNPELARAVGQDCNAAVDEILKASDTFDLTVQDVTVSGTSATARVRPGRDAEDERTVTLAKEGDLWKLADLGEPPS